MQLNDDASGRELTFRDLNSVLGEATNLIWGSFKNRYVGDGDNMSGLAQTQVPIIINHQRRVYFIRFRGPSTLSEVQPEGQWHPECRACADLSAVRVQSFLVA